MMKFITKKLLAAILFFVAQVGVAADIPKTGEHFLASPPEQLVGLKNPKVISFGCGRTAHIEINRLKQIFGSNFSYECIEKDEDKVKQYQIMPGSAVFVHAADGSDLKALLSLGLKLNDYDVAIVRHPDFHSYGIAFKKIFRRVIPQLLKRDGVLAVSLLHEKEEVYVAKKDNEQPHKSLDTMLIDLQYNIIKHVRLPHVDNHFSLPGSGRDKLQYYFQNRCNRASESLSVFTIDASPVDNQFLPTLVEHLEGNVVEQSEDNFVVRLNRAHMESLIGIYGFEAQELKREYCQNPGCKVYKTESKELLRCDRCNRVSYCGEECQKNHWVANHKNSCNQ